MSIEIAKAYFKKFDMDTRILEFEVSSATVELAAQAVGCEPARIAKTLSFCFIMLVQPVHILDTHLYKSSMD